MDDDDTPKRIQLIPATGWCAVYRGLDGVEERSQLIAWALLSDGTMAAVAWTYDGYDDGMTPSDASNFIRYERQTERDAATKLRGAIEYAVELLDDWKMKTTDVTPGDGGSAYLAAEAARQALRAVLEESPPTRFVP